MYMIMSTPNISAGVKDFCLPFVWWCRAFPLFLWYTIYMTVYIMKFYDRKNEIEILRENEKQASNSSVFTVLTGRRRVGKTSLIMHALEGRQWAYLFVSKDSEAVLCQKFQRELEEQVGINVYGQTANFRDFYTSPIHN